MRSKLFSIIICLLALSVGFGSCIKDENASSELSVSTIVTAFGLDTVYGKHYKFSIDQLNHVIFNADSMPVGSDSILARILIDTFTASGYVTSGINDTLVVTSDSMDLRKAINNDVGMHFNIYSGDLETIQEYTLKINVHMQEPDSMSWKQMSDMPEGFLTSSMGSKQKVVTLNDSILVFDASDATAIKAYIADGANPAAYQWSTVTVNGLPEDTDIRSLTASQGTLYAVSTSGDVYTSNNGESWTRSESLSGNVVALLGSLSTRLAAIRTVDGTQRFCTTESPAGTWTDGETVPTGFPTYNYSYTYQVSGTGTERIVLTGMPAQSGKTVPWMSMDGTGWADMATSSTYYCPEIENPSITYYDDKYYIIGGELDTVYASIGGLAWEGTTTKFTLPDDLAGAGTDYTMTVDDKKFVWIAISGTAGNKNQLWRGRLNKFGFKKQ